MVYVLSKKGNPLMPTENHAKVRILLKEKKAKVVKREPFTIQLKYDITEHVQNITLGIDAGSKVIGLSATTEKKELYAAEVTLRNDIVNLLATRRELRRARRNRKTRHRKARFKNRRRDDGWLAPSTRQKIDTHLKVVADIHKILPVSKIVVETAQFDIQKIENSNIEGKEYQQGEQMGFWNVREYVLWRDGHTCQHCKGKDKILNVHHIESRKTGGDAPNNLITLCVECHDKFHRGEIELKVKRGQSYGDAAFMGIMRWFFYDKLKEIYPNVKMTYGYITKDTRIKAGLKKTHYIDARCITGNPTAEPLGYYYHQKKVRCHNRQIHKANFLKGGVKKRNQAPYEVKGFRLFDKVVFEGKECFVFGRRSSGYFDLRTLNGTKIHNSAFYKRITLICSAKSILTERRRAA